MKKIKPRPFYERIAKANTFWLLHVKLFLTLFVTSTKESKGRVRLLYRREMPIVIECGHVHRYFNAPHLVQQRLVLVKPNGLEGVARCLSTQTSKQTYTLSPQRHTRTAPPMPPLNGVETKARVFKKACFAGVLLCSPPRTRHLSLPFSGLALFLVLTLHSNQAHTLPFVTTAEQESPPKWNPRSPSPSLLLPLLPPPNQRYPRQPQELPRQPQEHPRPLPDQPHQHQHQHQHRRHQDQEHQERMGAMEPPPRPHPHWDLSHPPSHQPSLLLTRRFHQEASTGSWANMSRSSPSRTRSLRARSTPSMFS